MLNEIYNTMEVKEIIHNSTCEAFLFLDTLSIIVLAWQKDTAGVKVKYFKDRWNRMLMYCKDMNSFVLGQSRLLVSW